MKVRLGLLIGDKLYKVKEFTIKDNSKEEIQKLIIKANKAIKQNDSFSDVERNTNEHYMLEEALRNWEYYNEIYRTDLSIFNPDLTVFGVLASENNLFYSKMIDF